MVRFRWLAVGTAIVASLSLGAPTVRVGPSAVAPTSQRHIEVSPGDLPLILSVPHGGHETPANLPDRDFGTPGRYDEWTQELSRQVADELQRLSGRRPHLVINLLHRRKLDPNREILDGAGGDPQAETAWNAYHSALEASSQQLVHTWREGLLIDLHGHRHERQWIELGYLLVASQLERPDSELDGEGAADASSLRALAARSKRPFSQLLRGGTSLGAFLEARHWESVPSPRNLAPPAGAFFSGGYITERHGSMAGGSIDAIQIETPTSLRDNGPRQARFAKDFAGALLQFLKEHYRLQL